MSNRRPRRVRPIVLILFVVSFLAVGLFVVRGFAQLIYWSDPAHQEQPLEPWMTLGYVARSYSLDRDDLATRLDLDPTFRRRATLETLAEERGQDFDAFARDLHAAIGQSGQP